MNTNTVLSTTPANAINFEDTSTLTFYAIVSNAVVGGYGTPTGNVAFFSNGTALGNGTPVSGSPGTWSITIPQNNDGLLELPLGQSRILAQYTGDSGHAPSSSAYTINVYDQNSTPDFAMQSNVTYQTISPGNRAAKFALQFTSMNNLAALGIPITLTYSAPSGITCSGAPAAPNFGNKLYATVNYTCKAAAGVTIGQLATPGSPRGLWMAEGGAALACIFLFGLPGRRRRWQALLGSMALFVIAFGVTGCGGSQMYSPLDQLAANSGTPNAAAAVLAPGTYTVIVTGTASVYNRSQANTTVNVVHNVPLKVVVQ